MYKEDDKQLLRNILPRKRKNLENAAMKEARWNICKKKAIAKIKFPFAHLHPHWGIKYLPVRLVTDPRTGYSWSNFQATDLPVCRYEKPQLKKKYKNVSIIFKKIDFYNRKIKLLYKLLKYFFSVINLFK